MSAVLPDHPAIETAAARIAGRVRVTPVVELERGAFGLAPAAAVTLKLESLQHAGSFKPRGAFNRVLAQAALPAAGLIAASGGNHGAAVAHVARTLGVRAEIFVPEIVAPAKLARLRDYGADVRVGGRDYAEALAACEARRAESGALPVHAYDDVDVVAGQGTLARELEAQAPRLDTVLVAVGGGGMIAGVAAWYAGRVRVVGVEPHGCATLRRALDAGVPVDVPVSGLAADSLGARRAGSIAFALAQAHVADVVLVDDDAIRAAQRALWRELRVFAEPGGATALAALLAGAYRPAPGERVGVIVCGGNGDPAALA
ncbi:MAG: threonine/serine dehydratase [Mizugakiibacter sp.]|uniref:threonine/serine dehydratase n=1 Tax=Mizugakiibacter sp. TaxID=1972610 RepID=UPI0031C249A9|nr:threonine/serine dehydratase [Xanthomonadaceae bacterium]